jgi:transcriptional regulator with XRE-family HTH domain
VDGGCGTVPTAGPSGTINWPALWHRLARQCRDLRHLCGVSQETLAAAAGVSQGAISRLESGRLHGFPVTTVTRVFAALAALTVPVDAAIPAEMLAALNLVRAVLPTLDTLPAPPLDPELAELVRLYQALPQRHRHVVLEVLRALAAHLAAC